MLADVHLVGVAEHPLGSSRSVRASSTVSNGMVNPVLPVAKEPCRVGRRAPMFRLIGASTARHTGCKWPSVSISRKASVRETER